jgi:carbonic anhydrase
MSPTRNPLVAVTQDAESQARVTPAQALALLKQGHERFRSGERVSRDLRAQTAATAEGQWPFALVLGCIDSRVPVELIFDQGVGDLFTVRLAGNVVTADVLGSMEFACAVAGAKLILVLGHSGCGAVKGACDAAELGHLTGLLERVGPALGAVAEPAEQSLRTSANAEFVQAVAEANVRLGMDAIPARSEVLRERIDAGTLGLVGAMYDVREGKLTFLEQGGSA